MSAAPSPAAVPPPAGDRLAPARCPWCGYERGADTCAKCGDGILDTPGGTPLSTPPRRGFFVFDLVRGFFGFFAGASMLFNRPEFAGKLKLPVIANLLVVTSVGVGLWFAFSALFAQVGGGGDLFGWFRGILAALLTLVSVYFLLPPLTELVIGPFLEPLVDTVDQSMGGPGMRPADRLVWTSVKDGTQSAVELLMIAGGGWLASLALALVGLLPLTFVVSAAVSALVWFELPTHRRGYRLRQRVALLRRNWAVGLGFGLAFQVGALIPFFNVFLLTPTAAVAAAALYLKMDKTGPARA
ncbi:MAG: EI24 domain-containing protein [Planctomycetota bacterium]